MGRRLNARCRRYSRVPLPGQRNPANHADRFGETHEGPLAGQKGGNNEPWNRIKQNHNPVIDA